MLTDFGASKYILSTEKEKEYVWALGITAYNIVCLELPIKNK